MALTSKSTSAAGELLNQELLQALDNLFGLHPGYRPVHAKGVFCSGTFTPSPEAASLTRAPHVQRDSTRVVVRFSNFAGIPTVADNNPEAASPRGMAIRFYLAEHVHTDIIGHSHDGFPTRTGEEFLEFARALAASGPDTPKPTALESFLATHPRAKQFLETPKPIPTSFARESFYGVTAFRFVNKDGTSRYGRFRVRPDAGSEYLDAAAAAAKTGHFLFDEIRERLAQGQVKFRILVQLAGSGDEVSDSTITWPEDRTQLEFGTVVLTECVPDNDPESQRIIFDPIPRVDGIDPSDDPLIELRAAIYLLSGRRRRAATAQ